MRVRYTLRAQADLEDIFSYLDERSLTTARAVRAEIKRRIDQLLDFPLMAPATEVPGVRELSVSRFPYKVYYELRGDEICVLHVRHTRRRPWTG
ncbi:MAG TPA: type II toxin-antitoxin system RelE/ParE family toxin [Xanthobacteraceae bacterium]|jgi:plasmid stabilization system protein ParE